MTETSPAENTNDKLQEPSSDQKGKSGELKRFLVCIVIGIVFMLVYGYLRALIYEEMFSVRQEFSLYPLILVVIYGALGGIMLAFYLQRKS